MKLTNKQKKQIYSCLTLAVTGDTLSFFNNEHRMDIQYSKKNEQNKLDAYNQLYLYNQYNIQGCAHSMYSIWLYFMPYKMKTKEKSTENITVPVHFIRNKDLMQKLYVTKLKYKYLKSFKIVKYNKKILNRYIIRLNKRSKYYENIMTIQNNKKIVTPSDEFILIGIIYGLKYLDESKFDKRDIDIVTLITSTHVHPYSYMAVILLSTLITYLFLTKDIIETLVKTNNYFKTKLDIQNKTEQKFCDEFDKYVQSTVITDEIVKVKIRKYSKLNALTTIFIALNSYLSFDNNWQMLIYLAGMKYQTTPATCAIACAFYGLVSGVKNVPKIQYKNIENGDNLIKNFYQNGKIKYLPYFM